MSGFYILSGAWGTSKQIQLWDIRTMKSVCEVEWENGDDYYPTYIYSVKFSPGREVKRFAVAGVNKPLYRIFEWEDINKPKAVVMPNEW